MSAWRAAHPYEALTRVSFAGVLAGALQQLNPAAVVAGYRATGLCPFNPEAVHYERLTSTNSRKFDERAFPQQSDCQTFDEDCKVAVRCIEAILGPEVVAIYNRLQTQQVIPLEILPPVNAYVVWKALKLNAEKSGEHECQQQLLLLPDGYLNSNDIDEISTEYETEPNIPQYDIGQQVQMTMECATTFESITELAAQTVINQQQITEDLQSLHTVSIATEHCPTTSLPLLHQCSVGQDDHDTSADTSPAITVLSSKHSSADRSSAGIAADSRARNLSAAASQSAQAITSLSVEQSLADLGVLLTDLIAAGVTAESMQAITSPSQLSSVVIADVHHPAAASPSTRCPVCDSSPSTSSDLHLRVSNFLFFCFVDVYGYLFCILKCCTILALVVVVTFYNFL